MFRALFNSVFKRPEAHPAMQGDMPRRYTHPDFGTFIFKPEIMIYQKETKLWAETCEVELDVKSLPSLERALACLACLDMSWFENALNTTADSEHMPLSEFGGEPEFWIDRAAFIEGMRNSPVLQILIEEDEEELSVDLFLEDGGLFAGHSIILNVSEQGEILYISLFG